ncbi:hypothetical protein IKF63_02015 [Candidatus Saccharibacteria bacterium]|nr:hypothetical protein [Candidatus Saccharibacteria bacterium]
MGAREFSRFGNVNGSNMNNVGVNGNWWSSTASSASNGYNLNMNGTELYPANSNNRQNGFSLRCVAE